jgi:hypothetical protein
MISSQIILNLTDSETIEVVDEGDGVIKFNYTANITTTFIYTNNDPINGANVDFRKKMLT